MRNSLVAQRLQRGDHCHVQFEATSLLGRIYLNAKYGLSLAVGRGGCDAITSKAYVQPDGTLFPCQDVAKEIGRHRDREAIHQAGVASWESDRFASIGQSTSAPSTYDGYTPCRSCPALGSLCTPCPLPGLRGKKVIQDACVRVMQRAKHEGISLNTGIRAAVESSAVDRLIQSPAFRRKVFSSDDPDTLLRESLDDETQRNELVSFRQDTVDQLRALLCTAINQLRDHDNAYSAQKDLVQ